MLSTPHPEAHWFQKQLLSWFAENARDLPWRQTRNPYQIWISEVMLQQTQVDRVIDYYQNFLQRFPTVQSLAKATWPQVLAKWRGLGYYRRGRNLLRDAKTICKEHGGIFPTDVETLETLPGIGPYTARAIAVFAYEQDVLVLDTNTSRVLSRFFGLEREKLVKTVAAASRTLVPKNKAWDFHQGLMDFGSSICGAKQPQCSICPVQKKCAFPKIPLSPKTLPQVKKLKEKVNKNQIEVAVAIIHRQGKLLIAKRPAGKHLAGLWEFPGGKKEKYETWRDCLKREIKEELNLEIAVRPHDWEIAFTYPEKQVLLRFHRCSILGGKEKGLEGQELRWVLPSELEKYNFPPANQTIVEKLKTARFVDPQK